MEVVSYIRVSKTEQHPENQREPINRFCENMGYTIINEYVDHGVSGRSRIIHRPAFRQLLSDFMPGSTSGIVVWKLDRLSRSLEDLIYIRGLLDSKFIQLISATENIETKTAAGRFAYHLFGATAEFESDRLSERIGAGLDRKLAEGGTLKRKEIPQEILQEIIDLYAEGVSLRKIAGKTGVPYSTVRNLIKGVKEDV